MSEHWASYSSLSQHRACPQKYFYSRIQRLEKVDPDDYKVEMYFGSWWHALRAADSIERGEAAGTLREKPDHLRVQDDVPEIDTGRGDLTETVLLAADAHWRGMTPLAQETWVEKLGGSLPERMRYVDERWRERWARDREHEQPLAVELRWERKLPMVPGGVDPNTIMVGYVDEVFLDTKRNLVVVRDHKTGKKLATQSTADDMMDSQLQVYAWGCSPMVLEWGLGPIRAVAYDRVRSVAPKTPKLNKSGTLSRSVLDYDAHTYREWALGPDGEGTPFEGLKKDGSSAGMYLPDQGVIEGLSDPAYLSGWQQRTLTPLNRNVVRTHLRAAIDTSMDITVTRERAAEAGEVGRNLSSACKWCDFVLLCRAQMVGGPDGEYDLAEMKLQKKTGR